VFAVGCRRVDVQIHTRHDYTDRCAYLVSGLVRAACD
jgi:hypothetical protein